MRRLKATGVTSWRL